MTSPFQIARAIACSSSCPGSGAQRATPRRAVAMRPSGPSSVVGPGTLGLCAPDGSPPAPFVSRPLAGEIVEPVERLIRAPGGQDRRVRMGAAPLRDGQGVVLGAVILIFAEA